MRILMEQVFNASPAQLYAVYTDPDFYHQRYAESGISDYRLEQFEDVAEGFEVRIALALGLTSEAIPAALARSLGGHQPVQYQLSWRPQGDHYSAQYLYAPQKLPLRLQGVLHIAPHAQGCLHSIDIQVSCDLPLVRGLAQKLIGERAKREISADFTALQARLNREMF